MLNGGSYTKKGLIIFVQVDHLSGEEIAWAMEALNRPGVYNRHIISTVTKKNRPGYVMLLDIDPDQEENIAEVIYEHLGVYGYHRLESQHVHQKTITQKHIINVCKGADMIRGKVRIKMLAENPHHFALESDDIVALGNQIKSKWNLEVSLLELKKGIEARIRSVSEGETEIILD